MKTAEKKMLMLAKFTTNSLNDLKTGKCNISGTAESQNAFPMIFDIGFLLMQVLVIPQLSNTSRM